MATTLPYLRLNATRKFYNTEYSIVWDYFPILAKQEAYLIYEIPGIMKRLLLSLKSIKRQHSDEIG